MTTLRAGVDSGAVSPGQRRSLRAAIAGNILEWFDWTLYATFSTYIAAHFFDDSDPSSALLSALAVFAVGFLARPVGGLVFGRVADRVGRRTALVATISTMAATTLLIAVLPGYDQIGAWASVLLVIVRLVQGLAHGGESGVSFTYVSEIAPAPRRGLWSSSVFFAVTLGVMAATAVGAVLTAVFDEVSMEAGAWRWAFVAGAVLGLYVLVLRRHAEESAPDAADDRADPTPPIGRLRALSLGGLVILLACGHNALYYTFATFAPAFAISARGMEAGAAFLVSLAAQAVGLGALLVWGSLSDRIGRRPMIFAFAAAAVVLVGPLTALIGSAPWTLFVAQAAGMTVWAMGAAMYPALISELFPTRVRATSVAVATSISVALFGGTAPYLVTWAESADALWMYAGWLMLLAALAAVGGLLIRETRGIDLARVGSPFRHEQEDSR